MNSTILAATVAAAALLTNSLAFADAPAKKGSPKKAAPVLVASAEPLPDLPPAAPAPAPLPAAPVKDAPASAPASETPSAGTGFLIDLTSGANVMTGRILEGVDAGAVQFTIGAKAGYYVTPHLGFLAGLQGGYGGMWEGCAGTCTNAFSFQVPVLAQYAFGDRTRGAYVDGGVALFSRYMAMNDTKEHPEEASEKLSMTTPFDFKLGAGYRIAQGASADKAASKAIDMRLGLDIGQFKTISYEVGSAKVDGDIVSEKQALHFVIGLSVGATFGL